MTQDQAFDLLTMGHNVFLTGAAGSGKTFLVNRFIAHARTYSISIAITASTGIAATHLWGMTIHSWSGLGIRDELSDSDIEILIGREYLAKRYAKTSVLVIDEISMLSWEFLTMLDRLLRSARMSIEPFGGIQVVLVGDFFQLPPVSQGLVSFAFEHPAWESLDLKTCVLSGQYRQGADPLLTILNEIRAGEVSEDSYELLKSRNVPVIGEDHSELFTRNIAVDSYNSARLESIWSSSQYYKMGAVGSEALVATMKKWCLAPEVLSLKIWARVMFVKNNFDAGYVNGSIGHVVRFHEGLPIVELLSGEMIPVEEASWVIEENGKIKAAITQLPLRLAWAITVHKSQGMTLDAAVMDLSDAFVPGQGYVALSRVCSLGGLTLKGFNAMALQIDERVREYDEIIRAQSRAIVRRLESTPPERIRLLREEAILRLGGTLESALPLIKKVMWKATYTESLELFRHRLPLVEIAEKRGLKVASIITHLGYWRDRGNTVDTDYYRPDDEDRLAAIHGVFDELQNESLAPVIEMLGESYSYDEIKLARVFYDTKMRE